MFSLSIVAKILLGNLVRQRFRYYFRYNKRQNVKAGDATFENGTLSAVIHPSIIFLDAFYFYFIFCDKTNPRIPAQMNRP